jgi:hypothetical protein
VVNGRKMQVEWTGTYIIEEAHHELPECLVDWVAPAKACMIGHREASPPPVLLKNCDVVVIVA